MASIETGFRPSVHGFAFRNRWNDPVLGLFPVRGLCGGMTFAVLDYFEADMPMPRALGPDDLPTEGSVLSRFIWRRQLGSMVAGFGLNAAHFLVWTFLPQNGPRGLTALTKRQVPRLMERLTGGPVLLGLISASPKRRMLRNHQVLAYAASETRGKVSVSVYDPNFPKRDDVVIEIDLDGDTGAVEIVGDRRIPWRAVFIERYAPVSVPEVVVGGEDGRPDPVVTFVLGVAALLALLGLTRLFRGRR